MLPTTEQEQEQEQVGKKTKERKKPNWKSLGEDSELRQAITRHISIIGPWISCNFYSECPTNKNLAFLQFLIGSAPSLRVGNTWYVSDMPQGMSYYYYLSPKVKDTLWTTVFATKYILRYVCGFLFSILVRKGSILACIFLLILDPFLSSL